MTVVAAFVAVALLVVIAVFQAALALGAPLGYAAWGGRHPGVLPTRLRVASAVAALVIYPLIILAVLAAAGLIGADWLPIDPRVLMWGLAAFLALGALANFASRSPRERIWGPVALAVALCGAVIAASPISS
jgi:hypothetical protein